MASAVSVGRISLCRARRQVKTRFSLPPDLSLETKRMAILFARGHPAHGQGRCKRWA